MSKVKVLVVEDEGLVARDVENMLKSLGYEVPAVVSTGEMAIRRAQDLLPDLVLMDIVLKGDVGGIAAAEKIWENLKIPVIYLTAYADEKTLQEAKKTDPFGYILKPFEERELQTAIEMALYKSGMEKKLRERERWLSTVLQSIGDGVIATSEEGRVTFMNPLAERISGLRQVEALGKPLEKVFKTSPETEPRLFQTKGTDASGGDGRGTTTESLLITRDGRRVPLEESFAPIIDDKRNVIGKVLVFRDIKERKNAEAELKRSWEKLKKALEGTIQAMALTVETRDPYTAGHQRRVSRLSYAMAQEMDLDEVQCEGIRLAGEIHDIGKIYVPAEILSKPGQITEIEYTIIKTHPQVGYDILKTIEFPWPIAEIIYQHHEWIDGSGYPRGLKGDQIILEARIISVADIVEAMSSHRPYRLAYGIDRALEEIIQRKGILYDAAAVEACLRMFLNKGFRFE
jgi:PAS domain S-box-containing protein/putative nucleotidyltransferase with HDIG domain